MSDRFAVSFFVGGNIKEELVDALAVCLEEEGLADDLKYVSETSTCAAIVREIKACAGEKPAKFVGWRVDDIHGRGELHNFCAAHDLSFLRRVKAGNDFDALVEWWQPGMSALGEWKCMNSNATAVLAPISYLEALVKDGRSLEYALKNLQQMAPMPPVLKIVK